jgi:probable selenium-dependent hydroxylase accessory protein YqeC
VLPPEPTTLLPVVSVRALGRPLDPATAHRPERVAWVTGAAPGEPLATIHLARLLASEAGSLHKSGTTVVVPVINMVEDEPSRRAARAIALGALAITQRFDRVVLAAMTADEPLVEVVERHPAR